MGKEENISLNGCKICGNSGRVMCSLKYEQEAYEEKLSKLPSVGSIVKTPDGTGEVDSVEILKEKIRVKLKDGEGFFYKKYDVSEITIIKTATKEVIGSEEEENKKELEELEKLQNEDKKVEQQ